MKPVEIEDFVSKIKALTADLGPSMTDDNDLMPTLAATESNLKAMDDAKESSVLLVILTVLLLPLTVYLLYRGYYWPSLIGVAWVGALIYYRTNERSMSVATLREKAKIAALQPVTKINYLLAAVQQKQERMSLMRLYNYAFWPFAVFMGQLILNTDLSSITLWLILIAIMAANAVFWYMNYKPMVTALSTLKQSLHDLQYQLIMQDTHSTTSTEEE